MYYNSFRAKPRTCLAHSCVYVVYIVVERYDGRDKYNRYNIIVFVQIALVQLQVLPLPYSPQPQALKPHIPQSHPTSSPPQSSSAAMVQSHSNTDPTSTKTPPLAVPSNASQARAATPDTVGRPAECRSSPRGRCGGVDRASRSWPPKK